MSLPIINDLPPELLLEVLRHCGARELIHIASTCSTLHPHAIRALYRTVDLSCHKVPMTAREYENMMGAEAVIPLQNRQNRFAATIIKHPEYGLLVESLAFRCMQRLKSLDLISFADRHERYPLPSFEFSKLEHIHIGGQMSFAFFRACIGSVDPARLINLDFDNLQDIGQMKDREPIDEEIKLSELAEYNDPQGTPMVRHTGPMRNFLWDFVGRCTALQRLALRSSGQDYDADFLWSDTIDAQRYKEYASFIRSVRGTLQHLVFEQAVRQGEIHRSCRAPHPHQTGARPMDKRFLNYILPVLIERPWPVLQSMEILGLGGRPRPCMLFDPPDMQIFINAKRKLATAVRSDTLLTVEENECRTLWLCEYDRPVYFSPRQWY
ncbi:hypothetical protein F5884DRAFT_262116 [Xylogone sp. PMI_703]|nr:hypothetical protein F5884DRAFT_262116 [Xylogone sp. PMI_703]